MKINALKIYVKTFFMFFLPILLLFFVIAAVLLFQKLKSQEIVLKVREKQNCEILRRTVKDDLDSVVSDLFFLSVNPLLHRMLENNNPDIRYKMAEEFKAFCKHSKLYDQIRFIDAKGMEQIRINFNHNNPYIVPDDQLQNKSKRYYFADTFALQPGRIFVSPFDLNIEHGEIEHPLKPMIRFGTPVADLKGNKRGIILLNYLGEKLIEDLKKALPHAISSFVLLNSKGYWLKADNVQDEWGFMYDDRKDRNFSIRYPEIWKKISDNSNGQFITHKNIYTFTTVYLLNHGMLSSSGSLRAFQASDFVIYGKKDHWKLVSLITKEKLNKLRTATLLGWLSYLCTGFLIMVLISLLLSFTLEQRRQALEERLKRGQLQSIIEMAGAVCHEFNQPLMIISGYSEMLSDEIIRDADQYEYIKKISEQVDRLGSITKKLMNITQYKTRDYLKGKIVDIHAASENDEKTNEKNV